MSVLNRSPRRLGRTLRAGAVLAAAGLVAAILPATPAGATVTPTYTGGSNSLGVIVDGADNVTIDCAGGAGSGLRVNGGVVTGAETACDTVVDITVTASGSFDNEIEINDADMVALTDVTISAGPGNDILSVNNLPAGTSVNLNGGTGFNDYYLSPGADHSITGAGTVDAVQYVSYSAGITFDATLAVASTDIVSMSGIEEVVGSPQADDIAIVAGMGADGGNGNDIITHATNSGTATFPVTGGAGTDTINMAVWTANVIVDIRATAPENSTGFGSNPLTGFEIAVGSQGVSGFVLSNGRSASGQGADDNFFIVDGQSSFGTLNGGGGTDTIWFDAWTSGITRSFAGLTNIENMVGTPFDDNLTGNGSPNRIEGRAGNDTINGGGGDDVLLGGPGTNTLDGSTGLDSVAAEGSAGSDTFVVDQSSPFTLTSSLGEVTTFTDMTFVDIEGRDGDDTISVDPGVTAVILSGGNGTDTLNYDDTGLTTSTGPSGNPGFTTISAAGVGDVDYFTADVENVNFGPPPPSNTAVPTITGTAQVGQTLTVVAGSWSGSGLSFTYQWSRCNAAGASCVDVPGATGFTYGVTSADSGSTIRARETATNGGGSVGATSVQTAVVPTVGPAPTAPATPAAPGVTPFGRGQIRISWAAPADGGSPITDYVITLDGTPINPAGAATDLTIGELTPGSLHSVTITAVNAVGSSAPSPAGSGRAGFGNGYWMLERNGRIYQFGAAQLFDQLPLPAGVTAVDFESTVTGDGLLVLGSNGVVYTRGVASNRGDVNLSTLQPGEHVSSIALTPSGNGYWVFTNRGRVVNFGDAGFFQDLAGATLNGPVIDAIPTPTGLGYYMVASDGGVFAFGDAVFRGSMGATPLTKPVVGLVPDPDNVGYWLVASDGGVFAFDAAFRGSMGAVTLAQPVNGMIPYGDGYLMVASDGGVFNFSTLPFEGSLGANPPGNPIVAITAIG